MPKMPIRSITVPWCAKGIFPIGILLFIVCSALMPARAHAGSPVLDEARQLYDSAKFGAAVAKLRDALTTGQVGGADALKAKELLGRSLVKAGDRIEAKESFKSLLRQDPSYRLDAVTVPPDEMEVFALALKEIHAEEIEAGRRVPASIAFFMGAGSGKNRDMGELVFSRGGPPEFESKSEFGGSVRFPLRPRVSLDIELSRFRATNVDAAGANFEASSIPLVLSLYWTAFPRARYRVNVFAGGGPMLASRAAMDFTLFAIPLQLTDEVVGTYLHGGVEGEYLFHPRVSVSGRLLGRYAKANNLFDGADPQLNIGRAREIDFSGFGASMGLRAYIGY